MNNKDYNMNEFQKYLKELSISVSDETVYLKYFNDSKIFTEHPYINKETAFKFDMILKGFFICDYLTLLYPIFVSGNDTSLIEEYSDNIKKINTIIDYLDGNSFYKLDNGNSSQNIELFSNISKMTLTKIYFEKLRDEYYNKIQKEINDYEEHLLEQIISEAERYQ